MKSKIAVLLFCLNLISLIGCGSNNEICSVSNCDNEVYKERLCPEHFVEYMARNAESDSENEEVTEGEIAIEETRVESETDIDKETDELSAEKLEKILLQQPCYIKRLSI